MNKTDIDLLAECMAEIALEERNIWSAIPPQERIKYRSGVKEFLGLLNTLAAPNYSGPRIDPDPSDPVPKIVYRDRIVEKVVEKVVEKPVYIETAPSGHDRVRGENPQVRHVYNAACEMTGYDPDRLTKLRYNKSVSGIRRAVAWVCRNAITPTPG